MILWLVAFYSSFFYKYFAFLQRFYKKTSDIGHYFTKGELSFYNLKLVSN